ncbi:hypothetical protein OG339_42880 [Streptosporangium sp. NBC_01495]|uniref:hypothetical protein n=1 Tax=Streptosporangium sp. NBC_01495 TaxID=2903899 RepID=UPI002E3316EC|nr:hypothetical protein [Streptosporangium sp. NBC_01495]
MAAHIYAASSGGPRGTGGLSVAELREPGNGIWCCYSHGKAIDSDAGNIFSAAQLKAWKRLHEARKSAEVNGQALDHYGLVESISVNSAPAWLAGRKFELGMRNIITGPNGSGKSILARLIASVACPDHVADISRHRNVDIEVRWFDPQIHDVYTSGRSGNVTHILDGQSVPYVARPYKTILLDGWSDQIHLGDLIRLAQMFDLSLSAMKATLSMLTESSDLIKEVHIVGTRIDWVVENDGRTVRSIGIRLLSHSLQSLILLELAGVHARHHARVEPTFLLIDGLLSLHHAKTQVSALERLQKVAEHAQVAVISASSLITTEASREWMLTTLDDRHAGSGQNPACPIDFEIETTTAYPLDPEPPSLP